MSEEKTLVLYDGKFTVSFKDTGHRYKVNGMPVKGVTTIMSNVLAKNGLMLWPLNKAMDYLKDKIETTEFINDNIASAMVTLKDLEDASKQHVIARDSGSSTGTTVHALAEQVLLGEQIDLLDHSEEVVKAIQGFEEWAATTVPGVLEVERVVYSAQDDYVGTLDSILCIDGKNYLTDLKTTNSSKDAPKGVYAENFIQLGGYAKAYLEETKDVPIDDLMIISCKKNGKVDTVKASDIGLSVGDCIKLWEAVHTLHKGLDSIKNELKVF